MTIDKKDVIDLLETISLYLELKAENPFKISAYRKAAQALETDDRSLNDIDNFSELKGIGKGTADVIAEYIAAGDSTTLKELQEEVPSGLIPLLDLPGLGGKKLAKLYQELNVTDAESLMNALKSGQVKALSGFGKKSAEKMIAALEQAGSRPERLPIAVMIPLAERIEAALDNIAEIEQYSRAGSLRRMRETNRDIDYIIATDQPDKVSEKLLELPNIKEIVAKGDTKVSVTIADVYDINVDFRLIEKKAFATTLHHFTGSKDHNVAMRQLAKAQGEKISEYGVEVEETGEVLTFSQEKDFFHHFGLHYIPPEVRENTGEVESFKSAYPLLELSDIQGDLHMHTTWSDGAQSVEEMVNQVRSKGYRFMAITDHSKYLRVAHGLNETRLRKQRQEIDRLNDKYDDIEIFAGVEMDILPDGTLDFSDDFLKEMDFVIGAIHSNFNQTEEQIMKRLDAALENPYVSLIAHPTGRLIGKRQGYQVNMQALIEKAKETDTALEINANPTRLDLSSEWVQKAQEHGVKIAINTDAHNYEMLDDMEYGASTARRGWIRKDTVLNTWPIEKLKAYLKRNK